MPSNVLPFTAASRPQPVTLVEPWARELAESVMGPAPFGVGDVVAHHSGRQVLIVHGAYWGLHGLSNYWSWREVLGDGALGPLESGYGWR